MAMPARWTWLWMPAIVVAAGIVAYLGSFQGVFLLDDMRHIVENPNLRGFASFWSSLGGDDRPLVSLSLALNYAIGGAWKPANAVPEYLDWPDSPFTGNLTGQWNHAGLAKLASYALQLLVGKKAFLGHNLPLLLVIPAVVFLWRRRAPYLPEAIFSVAVSACVWLVYAVGSSNYAGACLSIRWFVPLIAPCYFVIMLLLREAPNAAVDLGILTVGGIALMASAWPEGPWRLNLLPAQWPICGLTLIAWAAYRWRMGWSWVQAAPAEQERPQKLAA